MIRYHYLMIIESIEVNVCEVPSTVPGTWQVFGDDDDNDDYYHYYHILDNL